MSKADKKVKKDCGKKKGAMIAFALTTLGTRLISAVSLAAIAFSFCSVKKESILFNSCVGEIIESGQSASNAVRFCNGG